MMSQSNALTLSPQSHLTPILNVRFECDSPRVIQLCSVSGYPFDIRAFWCAAENADYQLICSVSSATQIGLTARSVTIKARSLASAPNRISASVVDGVCQSRNYYQTTGVGSDNPAILDIPPYAHLLSVWGARRVELLDSNLRPIARFSRRYHLQIPVVGAAKIRVTTAARQIYRALFHLTL